MRRTARSKQRRSSSNGRLILFLAGGIVTALLLVVMLISLEQRSPVQSAVPQPLAGSTPTVPPKPPSSSPPISKPSSSVTPNTFTFYDTLTQSNKPDPGFTDLVSEPKRPYSTTPSNSTTAPVSHPKKQEVRYTIQVAAVAERSTAEALAARLKQRGYAAFVSPHVVPKRGTWYRVRVGRFTDREAAKELAERLVRQERLTPYIAKE